MLNQALKNPHESPVYKVQNDANQYVEVAGPSGGCYEAESLPVSHGRKIHSILTSRNPSKLVYPIISQQVTDMLS